MNRALPTPSSPSTHATRLEKGLSYTHKCGKKLSDKLGSHSWQKGFITNGAKSFLISWMLDSSLLVAYCHEKGFAHSFQSFNTCYKVRKGALIYTVAKKLSDKLGPLMARVYNKWCKKLSYKLDAWGFVASPNPFLLTKDL
jgi:hypothetical protein